MALITCPECGRQISELAEACPGCGCPAKVWRAAEASPFAGLKEGDAFTLGRWAGEALNWCVLEAGESDVFALCETAIETQPFNVEQWRGNDWNGSNLQRWLAGAFRDAAFTADELAGIREITCLSEEEARSHFANDGSRVCKASASARNHGAYLCESLDSCCWWLRSPADEDTDAVYVDYYGRINPYGCSIDDRGVAVRPALRLSR